MSEQDAAPRIPRHLAIVMDGNGRWAKQRHRPRTSGHRAGQKAVRKAVEFCLRRGIGSLTLFAFSSENWQRPATEVRALMELFLRALASEVDQLHDNGVRIRFIGNLEAFDPKLRDGMLGAMAHTAANTALDMNVAVNYGGRWDIADAARRMAEAVVRGELEPGQIDETCMGRFTALADQPPLDLFIRTGGEHRVSNFLLWQLAYAELYFTDTLWPDVDAACLDEALADYARRERRYGRTGDQLAQGHQE
jgi:undecaprenyl diphosphate synthase